MNHFGHIDLRVRDITVALTFYSQLLPALGFTRTFYGAEWKAFAAGGDFPQVAYFALTKDPQHQANANRIAFWVESREEVDRIGRWRARLALRTWKAPARVQRLVRVTTPYSSLTRLATASKSTIESTDFLDSLIPRRHSNETGIA